MKQRKQTKPLLVLGAVATLSSQLSTDIALIVHAATTAQPSQVVSPQTTEAKLIAMMSGKGRYELKHLTTATHSDVTIQNGVAGEVIKQSFRVKNEGVTYLNLDLTLAGPTDSKVVVKVNNEVYLNTTVGRGKLAESTFMRIPEDGTNEALIEIEYTVGTGESVLSAQPLFKMSNLVVTNQTAPTETFEYRIQGETDWSTYDTVAGIKAAINSKDNSIPVEVRDVSGQVFNLELKAPKPNNPLLLVEDNGLFYLNHFNTPYNEYKSLEVRFNGGAWQKYKSGMNLDLIDNACVVDVKVVNEYGVETELTGQRYEFPELKQPTMTLVDGMVTLESPNIDQVNAKIEYQVNDGEWNTYKESFVPEYQDGEAILNVRISDIFGRALEAKSYQLTAPAPTGGSIQYENGFVSISPYTTGAKALSYETETYYRINGGEWTLYTKPFTIPAREWSGQGVTIESKGTNEFNMESQIQSLTLDESQRVIVKPSVTHVQHIYGHYKTHEDIRFGVSTQTNGGSKVTKTEWSTDGVTWNPFSYNIDLRFTVAGDHTLYIRATNEDGTVSDVYQQQLTITEAVAPVIEELSFLETELYVGGEYIPHWQVRHDEGTRLNRLEWGGDYDTMFDTPGEKTITLRAQDARGLWSDEVSYTFTVLPANKPVIQNLRLEETDIIVGEQYEFKYDLITQDPDTEIVDTFWSGDDLDTLFDTPGEKTVTLEVMDNRRIWSEVASCTFTVREPKAPVISLSSSSPNEFVEGDEIKLNYNVQYDKNANYQNIEWLSGKPANTVGTHQTTFRIQDTRGLWSKPFTMTYVVKQKEIIPTLTFSSNVLQVLYGSSLTSIYKQGVTINKGTADTVKYGAYTDTFDPFKVGKQTVKYLIKYTEKGVEKRAYAYRTIEVLSQEPTLTFSSSVLKVPYGSKLTAIYKKGVTIDKGSASTVKYGAYQDTFNPTKVGKQKVKYLIKYTENGVEKRKYVYRYIEVLSKAPTLNFSSSVLKVKKGTPLTSIYKKGVTVDKGSASTVKYGAYQNTFNPNKIGKQKVKYLIKYTENGVEKRTYAYRYIQVVN